MTRALVLVFILLSRNFSYADSVDSTSLFKTLKLQGDATLTSGNFRDDTKSLGTGSVGLFAETDRQLSFVAAFSFGSEGTTVNVADHAAYAGFLRNPSSTIGGQVRIRKLWHADLGYPNLRYLQAGVTGNFRGSAATLQVPDMGPSQKISVLAIEPAASIAILFDPKRDISLIADLGFTSRIWNKPHDNFRMGLSKESEPAITGSHFFWGIQGTAALQFGDVYVGVEWMRLWGGRLNELKEFAIVPYLGVRGTIDIGPAASRPAGKPGDAPPSGEDPQPGAPQQKTTQFAPIL